MPEICCDWCMLVRDKFDFTHVTIEHLWKNKEITKNQKNKKIITRCKK
jgi:hypothetical protein